MSKHLMAAISSHGLGHLAQLAPILNALRQQALLRQTPAFTLSVRAQLPEATLAQRIKLPFTPVWASDDFGMIMHDALRVDLVQSLLAYEKLHRNWQAQIDRVAAQLQADGVDALIANTPYLTLAAAHALGIQSVAICSLNWADILEQCVRQEPTALKDAGLSVAQLHQILDQIRQAYATASLVLRPEPAMPSPNLPAQTVAPLAQPATTANRAALLALIDRHTGTRWQDDQVWVVLTSMGGLEMALNPAHWPVLCAAKKVIYLMPPALAGDWPHTVPFDIERLSFESMMATCDLVLTKPGYGMFVEATACAKPVLYLGRPQWPESRYLIDWLEANNRAIEITPSQAASGEFGVSLQALLSDSHIPPRRFDGATEAANLVRQTLWPMAR